MARTLRELLEEMTPLQRRVFADLAATADDVDVWEEVIASANTQTTVAAISVLLARHGAASVPVTVGEELEGAISEGAEGSAGSITSTWDVDLAYEILAIGNLYPDLSYEGYRRMLLGDSPQETAPGSQTNWAAVRAGWKVPMIAMTETSTTVNLAIGLFYLMNRELDGPADLVPYFAVCPVCQAGVNNNTYDSVRDVERAGPWPAHVQCNHYPELLAPRMAADSGEVWAGG